MKLLQMNHVQKSFNDETLHVLKDISLSVEKGEVVAIIGPSGSGKSTLLRCATLLTEMDSGELIYGDIQAVHNDADGKAVYADKGELKKCQCLLFKSVIHYNSGYNSRINQSIYNNENSLSFPECRQFLLDHIIHKSP